MAIFNLEACAITIHYIHNATAVKQAHSAVRLMADKNGHDTTKGARERDFRERGRTEGMSIRHKACTGNSFNVNLAFGESNINRRRGEQTSTKDVDAVQEARHL